MAKRTRKILTITYTLSLALVAVLSLVIHYVLDEVIQEQSSSASIINVAGQQRMLSQRIAWLVVSLKENRNPALEQELEDSINLMRKNHHTLLIGDPDKDIQPLGSSVIRDMYFNPPLNIDDRTNKFLHDARNFLLKQTNPDERNQLADVVEEEVSGAFLDDLDSVVKRCEDESNQRIQMLREKQQTVLVIILSTLFIEALFVFRPVVARISQYTGKLQDTAEHDELSRLYNRRAFFTIAEKTLAFSKRHKLSLSLAYIDIDYFKKINDNLGHQKGDEVIVELAKDMLKATRASDVCARIGGEEFVVLFPDTDLEQAIKSMERLQEVIKNTTSCAEFTVSIGISDWQPGEEDIHQCLERADKALYSAKNNGRNQIAVKQSPQSVASQTELSQMQKETKT